MCTYVCMYVICRCPGRPKDIRSPPAEGAGPCELPATGARTELSPQEEHRVLVTPTHLFSLGIRYFKEEFSGLLHVFTAESVWSPAFQGTQQPFLLKLTSYSRFEIGEMIH